MKNSTITLKFPVTSKTPFEHHDVADFIIVALFGLVFVFGTFGNGLVYYYFHKKRRIRRTIPELLFSYLALVDFLSSIVNPFYYINFSLNHEKWLYSKFLCKTILPLGAILITIPGGIFVIIAFERERSIYFPAIKHFKLKTIKQAVAMVVIYAILINIYIMIDSTLVNGACKMTSSYQEKANWVPRLICFMIRDCTILFVFVFSNVRIVSRQRRYRYDGWQFGALWQKRRKDSIKIIRLMFVMAASYFILTIPTDLFNIIFLISHVANRSIKETPITMLVYSYMQWLQTTNACVNILIYYHMHKGFRQYFRKRFQCCCG